MAQWAIDLLDGDPAEGMAAIGGFTAGDDLGLGRGVAAISLGHSSWRDGVRTAIAFERSVNPEGVSSAVSGHRVVLASPCHSEALLPDENAMQETAEVVRIAEESGDDVALGTAHIAYGLMLSRRDTDAERNLGLEYLRRGRDSHVQQRISATAVDGGYPYCRNDRRRGRRPTRDRKCTSGTQHPCRERREVHAWCCYRCAGAIAASARFGRRPAGSRDRNRTVGCGTDGSRVRAQRNSAVADACAAGSCSRRRGRLPRLRRSLRRDGNDRSVSRATWRSPRRCVSARTSRRA